MILFLTLLQEFKPEGNRRTDKPTNVQPTKYFFGKTLITIIEFHFHFVGIAALGARFLTFSLSHFLTFSVYRLFCCSVVLLFCFSVVLLLCYSVSLPPVPPFECF